MSIRGLLGVVRPKGLYRPDIDGMRALAVLAVVAYHYSPANLPGGFIGVDIFFVISGYLITGILVRGVEDRRFASYGQLLWDFYQRRVRRIFPALILILIVCLSLGWLVLFASEYARVGKYVAAGAGYVENFVLWSESGYFDHAAIDKPLLHLWSLAVEEQFYIFWPLILWVVAKRRWPLMASICSIAAATFVLNVLLVFSGHTTQAFYSPITRTWELMTGAWLAVAQRRGVTWLGHWRNAQAWLGLLLTALGLLFIRPTSAFPGLWALLPVLGTALLINAGAGASTQLNAKLLSWQPAVWVGLISYPLYLWHWMLYSFASIVFGEGSPVLRHASKIALFCLSLVLAWLTYRYFEGPIRRSRKLGTSIGLVIAVAVVGAAGLSVFLGAGVPDRPATLVSANAQRYVASIRMSATAQLRTCFNPQTSMSFLERERHRDSLPAKWYCELGNAHAARTLLAYGDSHARALIPALDHYGKAFDTRVVFASVGSCLPLVGVTVRTSYPDACAALGRRMLAYARVAHPDAVVLMEAWTSYLSPRNVVVPGAASTAEVLRHGLQKTLAGYRALGVPVVLVEDNPIQRGAIPRAKIRFARNPSEHAINATAITVAEYRQQQARVDSILQSSVADASNASIVSPGHALCGADICPWVRDGQFLYYDTGHLSDAGATAVYPLLARSLNSAMNGGGTPAPGH